MQVCPACDTANPDGFRFCGSCGAPLTAPAPAREERKVVSVLFTDLVGFTSRSERLDPEDVRAMLHPYYARLREQIEERGGLVEKFIGDAVVAVFGAPVAHEDDPERAVRTALAIREAIRELNEADPALELQIRTAVNTGEAIVALDARPQQGEGIASGDVVNTAARLQSAAPVDGILVGDATYRATRSMIEYREAPLVDAKGKSQPLHAWEVVAARSRFGIDVEQQRRSALVGRERELAVLTEAFRRCKDERTAQLVTLVGVPGIGKSRLVAELFQALDADPELYWWRQGRSLPYGESQSFWALGEIVKAQAGILETDDARAAERKLATLVADLVPEGERAWVESHLRPLAGIAIDTDESGDRRDEAFAAWRLVLEGLAEQRPLVLVFEDLHWADDGLLDFVDYLAEWAVDVPLLVVGTARPELLSRRPGWGGGKRNATTLSVGALSEEDTARLLASLLDQTLLPADVQRELLRRAEGNPLYAGEYVRMLQDRGFIVNGRLEHADDLPLPETVQGMIAARLDALTPAEKELVQDAAVLGKVFWPSALAHAGIEESLHALERKEFVRRDRRSAVAGETQYAFLHLLVRDVAYGQIPRARRVEKHRAAAEWIESLAPDRSEDRAEMLAHHYGEALRLAEAAGLDAGPLRAPARAALAEASERAAALYAWPAAERLAREALELTDDGDPIAPTLQLRIARATAFEGRPEPQLAETASAGFLAQGEVAQAAESEALLSWMAWWSGDAAAGSRHSTRALELVRDLPTSVSKARAVSQAARRAAVAAELDLATELAEQTLAMAEELGHDELASQALNTLGLARRGVGEGIAYLERSMELADRSKVPDEIIKSRNNLAVRYWVAGRLRESIAVQEESRELARRYGSEGWLVWAEAVAAWRLLWAGDLSGALAEAEGVIAKAGPQDAVRLSARVTRSAVLARRGRLEEALSESAAVLDVVRAEGEVQALAPALMLHAVALFLAGAAAEASAVIDELLAEKRLIRFILAEVLLLLVELGRVEDVVPATLEMPTDSRWLDAADALAAGELTRAADVYEEIGAPFVEAWTRLIAAERGDATGLERARAYFASQDARPFLARCEALLQASA